MLHRLSPCLLAAAAAALLTLGACQGNGDSSAGEAAPSPSTQAGDSLQQPPYSSEAEGQVPDIDLPRLDGGTLNLTDHRGEVVLVNFWATWCAPCIREIPDLAALHEQFGPEGLTIVGVSVDEGGLDTVRPFAEEHDIPYPLVAATAEFTAAFGEVYSLPTTFLINRDGEIERRVIGIFPVDAMRPQLRSMLGLPSAAEAAIRTPETPRG